MQGDEAVLQCTYEKNRLKWYINNKIIASESTVVDPTKYKVSVNPNTGLYYRLHVQSVQRNDEGVYSCNGGLIESYYIQLFIYGKNFYIKHADTFSIKLIKSSRRHLVTLSCLVAFIWISRIKIMSYSVSKFLKIMRCVMMIDETTTIVEWQMLC